jgi:peptidoglycan hydrolase-like protein with peptidoglycan-binding domain
MKNKKIIIWAAVFLPVAIGGFFLFKYFKKGPKDYYIPPGPAETPVKSLSPASDFPVRYGSKGDLVKQLQRLLGVTADGIFGAKTQAALLAQTGKISIADQATFDKVIAQLTAKVAAGASLQRANQLTDQWKKSTTLQLMPTVNVSAQGVTKDGFGALHPANKTLNLYQSKKYNREDYVLQGGTKEGFLLFEVTRGDLKGLWKVDSAKVTVA